MRALRQSLTRFFLGGGKGAAGENTGRFTGDRLQEPGRVAVLFTVTWCPFCRSFEKAWEEWFAPEGVGKLRVDISDERDPLWETFGVEIVPTVALFEEGRLGWRRDGIAGVGLGKADLRALTEAATH